MPSAGQPHRYVKGVTRIAKTPGCNLSGDRLMLKLAQRVAAAQTLPGIVDHCRTGLLPKRGNGPLSAVVLHSRVLMCDAWGSQCGAASGVVRQACSLSCSQVSRPCRVCAGEEGAGHAALPGQEPGPLL